ncbi:MAG: hypothetical protein IPJ49_18815 [Candidatus Obscuribacter sp.]|nr:hypothetical protein [Candidatus Obscuribacter sp.]
MKIAIMGTGGVGGLFGARLAAAGGDVTFIARGEHLKAIQQNGLQIISEMRGDTLVKPASAVANVEGLAPVDFVLSQSSSGTPRVLLRLFDQLLAKILLLYPSKMVSRVMLC